MNTQEVLKSVAVIGAAGKMGMGISLVLLQEIAKLESTLLGKTGSGQYRLTLIDSNEKGLINLKNYLRIHLTRYAEKNINQLRKDFMNNPKLVSNEEIIRAFVEGALDNVYTASDISFAKKSNLVFEAIVEDIQAKESLFSKLKQMSEKQQFYFTNTSSIPISLLNKNCSLEQRIIGFHFYNPASVHKLLEIVTLENTNSTLLQIAKELAGIMKKTCVYSKDVAGFIGNGFFIREFFYFLDQSMKLKDALHIPFTQAIYLINYITEKYLVRPMGIFQLVDFVGIDVCKNIAKVMSEQIPAPSLDINCLDMLSNMPIGGQNPDGTQKPGIFEYQNHSIQNIYSFEEKKYISIQPLEKEVEHLLGPLPKNIILWKNLQKEKNPEEKTQTYLKNLLSENTSGATLAKQYLKNAKEIANKLVDQGIACNASDVNTVLMLGFFHPYGVTTLEGV